MRLIFRSFIYLAAFVISIVLMGALGIIASVRTATPRPADDHPARIIAPPPPPYDATKPTVAVVLGSQVHDITATME